MKQKPLWAIFWDVDKKDVCDVLYDICQTRAEAEILIKRLREICCWDWTYKIVKYVPENKERI